jgi:DNA-binding transcriptional LysR family regulator
VNVPHARVKVMPDVSRQKADWSDLRIFWAVAEAGSFGAAGRALGVSQPTVTRRMDDLESRLGVQLLIRGPAGISLTEPGRLILDQVLTMERSAEAIERMVLNHDRRPEGRIGIGAPDGVGGLVLAPALPAFLRANPKISISLDCGFWSDRPPAGHTDLFVQFDNAGGDPDMISTPLAHYHYALFAAPGYLELYGEPKTLQEVAAHRLVHHSAMTRQPETWAPKTEAFQRLADYSLLTNSSTVTLNAVRAGAGISAMPTMVLTLAPELVMLDIPPMAHPQLWVCHHRDIARSARVRLVVDWLKELFDPRTQPWYRAEFVHPAEFGPPIRRRA